MPGTRTEQGFWGADLQVVLAVVVEGEALGSPLALVVAGALADAVDVAPVLLCLGVLEGVPIHLARAGEQEPGLYGVHWRLAAWIVGTCGAGQDRTGQQGAAAGSATGDGLGDAWCCAVEGQPGSTLVRLARPSMFMVPRKLVFMVLMGLYLQQECPWTREGGTLLAAGALPGSLQATTTMRAQRTA